ncbi:bacteriophage lambda NinG [Pseudomonas sp. Pc102]|uniref:recombination protein NinG n=1 Tax=Pseudomonas sp. Pc102 TaxID=2678261 RepID=UPI001BCBA1C5|nr:recombination protein NinG [Pseudomonas sp. Pc102]BBP82445.1 bacteriophage lambda NinG [Pseudomonas sp. Pc102]
MQAKSRPKKCRHCRQQFTPARSMQIVCSPACGLGLVKAKQERERKALDKIERREIRTARERLKRRGDYMREAQQAFNEFIRIRDEGKPCISCGRNDGEVRAQVVGGSWDAGHYRSVGACIELRFEPLNCHRQCKQCNRDNSGNHVEYRINLVKRIGQELVDWLEGPHEPRRWTIEDLKAIKADFRARSRALKVESSRARTFGG